MKNSLLALLTILLLSSCSNSEIRTVDIKQLFDEFKYTKELQLEYKLKTQQEEAALDSMYKQLAAIKQLTLSDGSTEAAVQEMEMRFNQRYTRFEDFKAELTAKSDEKVLNQLSNYIQQYAEKKELDMIVAKTQDDVTVLYAEESMDITQEVLTFINDLYDAK